MLVPTKADGSPTTVTDKTTPEFPVWVPIITVPAFGPLYDPDSVIVTVMITVPVLPELGLALALPPLPVDTVEAGVALADPVLPVLPELDWDEELVLPDVALPLAEGLDVAEPEAPVLPELPEVAELDESVEPEPPVSEAEPDPEPVLPEPVPPEPVLPAPVLPEPVFAEAVAVAEPVGPEAPVLPEVAVPVAVGLVLADPVFPPVEVEEDEEAPELPGVALAVVVELAAPELPPVTVTLDEPELPEWASTATPPAPEPE